MKAQAVQNEKLKNDNKELRKKLQKTISLITDKELNKENISLQQDNIGLHLSNKLGNDEQKKNIVRSLFN